MLRSAMVLRTSRQLVVISHARSREGVLTVSPPAIVLPAEVDAVTLGHAGAVALGRFVRSTLSVQDLADTSKEVFVQLGAKDPRAFMRRALTVNLEEEEPAQLIVYPTRREHGSGFLNDATRRIVLQSVEDGALGAAILEAFISCS